MFEIWLFGYLLGTLGSTAALLALLVALGAVSYLALTIAPAMVRSDGRDRARHAGLAIGVVSLGLTLSGVRVGSPGSVGELVPTLAVCFALASVAGSCTTLAWALGARALRAASGAREGHAAELIAAQIAETRRLDEGRRAHADGDDLRAEVAEADAAVLRLRGALDRLAFTQKDVTRRLAALDDDDRTSELGRELATARDDVATKLDLGAKILRAAEAAAFRLACSAPVKRLLRQLPRDAARDLGSDLARVEPAAAALRTFLGATERARESLALLAARRDAADPNDAWVQATRDLDAVTKAYTVVLQRVEVVRVRLVASGEMDAVASAAGEVEGRTRASGIDAAELSDLVGEVSRAELAIQNATPGDSDGHALTDALARSTVALDRADGASIDDLLTAMRELG